MNKKELTISILEEILKQPIQDKIEIKTYKVFADCDYNKTSEEIITTNDKNVAYREYKDYDESLSERGDTLVFLEEKVDTYKLNKKKYNADVEEYDYTFDDIYDPKNDFIDFDYFELINEGEFKIIKNREIEGSEVDAEELEHSIWVHLKSKYKWSGLNYRSIKYKGKTIAIRLKNHSARPSRLENNTLSIVICNDNKTDNWSGMNEDNEIIINGDTKLKDAEKLIKNKLDEISERLDENITKLKNIITEIIKSHLNF